MSSAYVCLFLGLFLLLFGLTSFLIRGRLFLTSAVIAMTFGESYGQGQTHISQVLYWVPKSSSTHVIPAELTGSWLHVIHGGWDTSSENDHAKQTLLWVRLHIS